jgi:hypothetical protein
MAEVITETILPGTYIQVNTEGLLTIGAIATGNVGLIGTAEMGTDTIQTLSSLEEGRARFGDMGVWDRAQPDSNISLVRALKLLFDNGASTVYARRVVATVDEAAQSVTAAKAATYQVLTEANAPALSLRAWTPGTWGNRLQIRVEPAEATDQVSDEAVRRTNAIFRLSAQQVFAPTNGAAAALGTVTVREHGLLTRLALTTATPTATSVQLNPTNRTFTFGTAPSADAEVRASYRVPQEALRKVTLRYGNRREVYVTPSLSYLVQQLQDASNPSRLVEVVEQAGNGLPRSTTNFEAFTGGDNGTVSLSHFQEALDAMIDSPVQLIIVAGRSFSQIKSAILGHVERTENLGRERIAVVGADSSEVQKILENANDVADKRVVLVAPGLRQHDPASGQMVDLPPSFAAAAVAGKLASLPPHVSLTNKTLAGIDALPVAYNYGDLKALVQNRVLALETRRGVRVVKGITTDDQAFKQITLRRIIDYVKEGTRLGANQYIGLLNNTRVRENLRTTLDGFLADLLLREFLTGYKLTVFADRAMEIRGEVQVVMDLNPTFSIDVIRVVMNLS